MNLAGTRRQFLTGAAALGASAFAGIAGRGYAASSAPVTLTIANVQWLDALRGKTLWNALLQYQKVAPNVTLAQEAIPAATFGDKITTELGAGQGPDILVMADNLFYPFADAGLLVPLDDAVKGAALNSTNDGAVVKGERLGVAWQRVGYALIYNKKLLDAAGATVPTNVDDLIAQAQKVSSATGAIGFAARHLMNDFNNWTDNFQSWAFGYGTNWVDSTGKLTINTPEAAAAMAAFKKVYDAKIIAIGDDMPTQRARFKANKVAFTIDNSGSALNIVSGGDLKSADTYAAPLPFEHPGAYDQIFMGVNANSKQQDAAMDFVRWFVSPAAQQALRDASGPDTLATDVPINQDFAAANPWAETFLKIAPTERSTLIPGREVNTLPIMRPVMEAFSRVLVSNEDPTTALGEAQQQVDALHL